jgi:hypothetical protein
MLLRIFSATTILFGCAIPTFAQVNVVDLIPENALGAIAIQNLKALREKGDRLIDDQKLNVPTRPSEVFKQLVGLLAIDGGALDFNGPALIVIANPKEAKVNVDKDNLMSFLSLVAVVVTIKDEETACASLGLKKGSLEEGKVVTALNNRMYLREVARRGKQLYLGSIRAALESVLKSKPVRGVLSPAQEKSFSEADLFLYVNAVVVGDKWADDLSSLEQEFRKANKADENKEQIDEFVKALSALRFGLLGCKVEDGLRFQLAAVFDPASKDAKKFLQLFQGGKGAADLTGLAEGQVLVAQSAKGDGSQNSFLARLIANFILANAINGGSTLSVADVPLYTGVMSEVWNRLQGERLALYRNEDNVKHGLFTMVAILDPVNAEAFLPELKELNRFANAEKWRLGPDGDKDDIATIKQLVADLGNNRFRVREAASARLILLGEPALPFVEKGIESDDAEVHSRSEKIKVAIVASIQELRKEALNKLSVTVRPKLCFVDKPTQQGGHEIETLQLKFSEADMENPKRLRQLFGPNWNRIRFARVRDHVVMVVGSDDRKFLETLANVKEGKRGLEDSKSVAGFRKYPDPARKLQFQVSVRSVLELMNAEELKKPGDVKHDAPLSAFGLSAEANRLQLDFWLTVGDLAEILKN